MCLASNKGSCSATSKLLMLRLTTFGHALWDNPEVCCTTTECLQVQNNGIMWSDGKRFRSCNTPCKKQTKLLSHLKSPTPHTGHTLLRARWPVIEGIVICQTRRMVMRMQVHSSVLPESSSSGSHVTISASLRSNPWPTHRFLKKAWCSPL